MVSTAASDDTRAESPLERFFAIRERGSTVRTEVLGGVVTFLTMCYIVFVNPAILSAAHMPVGAVTVATALAAAVATIAMGLLTNLPFALASGLGLNAIVAFDLILGRKLAWPVAMSCIVLEGLVALVLSARRVRGAILLGILASTALGLIFGVLDGPSKVAEFPSSSSFSTIGDALDPSNLGDAITWALVPVIFTLFMSDFFDTVGTAVAVSSQGGLLDEQGQVPRLKRLLLVDSGAAAFGGAMGVSSVTTYVESGAGVGEGARTGLASVVTAGLFLLTIFFVPLVALVAQSVPYVDD